MPPTNPADYSITHHIPVADHVYKYLLKRCGSDQLKATRNSTIGSLILSLHGSNADVRPKSSGFTRIFSATISESHYQKLGKYFTAKSAQLFNDQVDNMFREELFYHLIINKEIREKMYLKSIREYCEVYDITEEDIKIETLSRDFKRRKKEYDNQLNLTPTGTS